MPRAHAVIAAGAAGCHASPMNSTAWSVEALEGLSATLLPRVNAHLATLHDKVGRLWRAI